MKKILLFLFLTIIALVVFDKVIGYAFMRTVFIRAESGESGGTINYALHHKDSYDFLILGASRAKHGINPSLLTSIGGRGYNIGINATDVVNQLLVLDILLRSDVKPSYIILQTDAYTYDDKDNMLQNQVARVYPYDTPLIRSYVHTLPISEQMLYFFETYKLNRKMLNLIVNAYFKHTENSNGYIGLPELPQGPDSTLTKMHYSVSATSTNAIALATIANLAEEHGIPLILVLAPSYNNALYDEKEYKKLKTLIPKTKNLYLIDLADISSQKLLADPSMWRDANHMTARGAAVFSKILNSEISKSVPRIK